jgi:hypothetical protein
MVSARRRRHVPRSFIKALVSPDSFGSVLLLLIFTYAVAVSIQSAWAQSLVLLIQVATVGLILRVSEAHRVVRIVAGVTFVLATVAAVANLLGSEDTAVGDLGVPHRRPPVPDRTGVGPAQAGAGR